jgi:hypothetical protein
MNEGDPERSLSVAARADQAASSLLDVTAVMVAANATHSAARRPGRCRRGDHQGADRARGAHLAGGGAGLAARHGRPPGRHRRRAGWGWFTAASNSTGSMSNLISVQLRLDPQARSVRNLAAAPEILGRIVQVVRRGCPVVVIAAWPS